MTGQLRGEADELRAQIANLHAQLADADARTKAHQSTKGDLEVKVCISAVSVHACLCTHILCRTSRVTWNTDRHSRGPGPQQSRRARVKPSRGQDRRGHVSPPDEQHGDPVCVFLSRH
jgi:hypothetical protein